MIYVAPAVPPVSVHQCQLSVLIHATCQFPSVPHISAHLSCLSVSPISASQCHPSVPYMSAALRCPTVMPVNAHQCNLLVPPHQCHLPVSISAAYQCLSLQPH
ncbi:unnamed protein product [Staurois parvus]|uniref:Uncharacterized protein n=1 Tax=Staurois parvus TaxID=386267 RepID=A0ABN9ARK4_9NEOB|nr:unnamed protein product [Staurois parvus]